MTLVASEPTIHIGIGGEDLRARYEQANERMRQLATVTDDDQVLQPWGGVILCVEPDPLPDEEVLSPGSERSIISVGSTPVVDESIPVSWRLHHAAEMRTGHVTTLMRAHPVGETALSTLVDFFLPHHRAVVP